MMKNGIGLFMLFAFSLLTLSCQGQNEASFEGYTYKNGDPNGTGKWYLGREIAHVMGFQGMSWLERSEREQEEKTTLLLKNMKLQPTDVIADIGAGSGYHVFKMAPEASQGIIYAVDIQPEMLVAIEARRATEQIENIELILGSERSVNLPENSLDKALMVDVYHEFSFPVEMIASIKKALKEDGKIYLIEYKGEDRFRESVPIKKVHKMTEAQAIKEMEAAGFILEINIENLPWQHCMVFIKK